MIELKGKTGNSTIVGEFNTTQNPTCALGNAYPSPPPDDRTPQISLLSSFSQVLLRTSWEASRVSQEHLIIWVINLSLPSWVHVWHQQIQHRNQVWVADAHHIGEWPQQRGLWAVPSAWSRPPALSSLALACCLPLELLLPGKRALCLLGKRRRWAPARLHHPPKAAVPGKRRSMRETGESHSSWNLN